MSIGGSSVAGGGGASSLEQVLVLLANPEAMKAKLQEFKDLEARARKMIELTGPASEIVALRDKVKEDRGEAAAVLAKANKDAQELIGEAEKGAVAIMAAARDAADSLKVEAHAIRNSAQEVSSKLSLERQGLDEHKVVVEAETRRLAALDKQLRGKEQQLLNERTTLDARIGAFKQAQVRAAEALEI